MRRIVLATASYTARSLIASAQRCVNLYPEANPVDAAAPMTFYGTPGRVLWSTLPTAPVRGMWKASTGDLYAVGGSRLYRYNAGAWIDLAGLATISGHVYAADNGISAVFVDGTTAAPTVNLSTYVTGLMAGTGWYGADFVEFLSGFFIFNKPGTQICYTTAAYDLTIDALDFASAEYSPDKIVRIIRDHNEMWMLGEKSGEVFGAVAEAFPFERIGGATQESGCAAPGSVCRMDNSMIWLGADERGDAMVWRAQGYQGVRISTHAFEEEMRKYERIDDAFAYSYQQAGHSFYVLTFPLADKTWAYDAATGQWHERSYRTQANVAQRVRDNCHVFYDRKHLVGDWETGAIYELDLDTYTDNGAEIRRVKSFQHMTADGARQFFSKMVLDMQAAGGVELDPQVSMRWSDDGGNTWSALLTVSLGRVGQYLNKPTFNRLGMGRDRVFEVSTSANAKIAIQGAFVEAQVGTS
jgi:hypothetical protein